MAIDQLKGAAGVEFITTDLSAYGTNDDTSFKVGLVGWTAQGPANQVVSINSVNQLYSLFGTPGKTAKNNQLLYAGALLLNTGAVLKVVRQVEVDENLSAASIVFNNNKDYLNYDEVMSSGFSGTFSGGNAYEGSYSTISNEKYVAKSNKISSVINDLASNIEIDQDTAANSAFTIASKYPGFNGYYVSVQTYSYYSETNEAENIGGTRDTNIDTFTSKKIEDDIAFTSYVQGEGYYDVSQDRFFPNETFEIIDDNDAVLDNVKGVFKRYDATTKTWTVNEDLTKLIHIFGVIRVYSSKTAKKPVQVIPFTRINYVTTTGIQRKLDVVTKSGTLVVGKINEEFSGVWTGKPSYTLYRNTNTNALNKYVTTTNLVELKVLGTNETKPKEAPVYSLGWSLFKDISAVKVNLLCSAGTTVNGFGAKVELEEVINQATIVEMLNVCTIRKDCIAIFDLPKRKDVEYLIEEVNSYVPGVGMESGGSNATFESFWGAMYDGRQIMFDTFNKKDVEVAMTSFVAQNITNVYLNTYPWYIVAGTSRGTIGYPSNGSVYVRYYPDQVGALSLERINTTRNLNGQLIWGESTLQLKNTSLNRLHAASTLAYIYGTLRTKLTPYVFELNTPTIRKAIWNEVNDVLKFIKNHDGLYDYEIVCDDRNNTPTVIDQGELIVDIAIEIAKGVERIRVQNTVYATGGITQAGLH